MTDAPLSDRRLREICLEACRSAAETIDATNSFTPVSTKSTDTDIVTATDLAAEATIRDVISAAAPGSNVLGEEEGRAQAGVGPHGDVEWVVDPLDGTVNFAYRIPVTAVSVAAVRNGSPVAGAVVDVARGEMFSAERDGGAWLDGVPISVGRCTEPAQALTVTGYAYDADRRRVHGRMIADLLGHVRDVRAFGSAALHLCWVACGRADLYVERDIRPWDHCAGSLIAGEAGAVVELPCAENDRIVMASNAALRVRLRPLVS
ncbi:MAG: inositol monophosphatase family protein [Actinomycetota bacterium]